MTERSALPRPQPVWPIVLIGAVLLVGSIVLGLAWGSQSVSLNAALDAQHPDHRVASTILWSVRVPRVCLAALVGAVLALAGMLFQSLLRNPLASPFTLGVAGGGALGAYCMILFEGSVLAWLGTGGAGLWGMAGLRALGAFGGVMVTVALVFALARAAGGTQAVTLLLAGVTLNYICAAGVMLIQSVANFAQTMSMVRWSMGGLSVSAGQLGPTAVMVAIGFVITLPALRHLDVMSVDDRTAHLLGVPVRRVRTQVILGSAVMVGACLAVAGPIGFVGLMVPHVGRLLVGPSHRRLLPAVVFLGASLLVMADALGRAIPAHLLGRAGEIPVGVLTAACGGPFFLVILLSQGRRGGGL